MSYEISPTTNAKFMFNLKAENHQVILTSQVYEQKQSALDGIASVQANGPYSKNFEHKVSTASEPYFVLKAQNGEIIGTSQMYSSAAAAEIGITSVQLNSRSQEITTVE
ncbi:MAG: YegP family protein [Rariglobus sp.]